MHETKAMLLKPRLRIDTYMIYSFLPQQDLVWAKNLLFVFTSASSEALGM